MQRLSAGGIDPDAATSVKTIRRGQFDCLGVKKFFVLPRERRFAREHVGNAGRKLVIEVRDAARGGRGCAECARSAFERILAERLAARAEIGAQIGARDVEQRPDRRARREAGSPASPRVPAPRSSRSRKVSA